MNRLSLWPLALSCALIILFTGCRSVTPSVSYYILNPVTEGPVFPAGVDSNLSMTIGINPIELPGYLDRLQMVKRTGPNQLDVSSRHRWADYPDRMVQRVLGDNLQLLMTDTRVASAPWPAGLKPDVTVDVTFLELIGTIDKTMLLNAVWTITVDGDLSPSYRTTLSEAISGAGFDDLAAAHSHVLETLSRDIAERLKGFLK